MTTLTFLQVNDLHGYVAPHPEMVRASMDIGGSPSLADWRG